MDAHWNTIWQNFHGHLRFHISCDARCITWPGTNCSRTEEDDIGTASLNPIDKGKQVAKSPKLETSRVDSLRDETNKTHTHTPWVGCSWWGALLKPRNSKHIPVGAPWMGWFPGRSNERVIPPGPQLPDLSVEGFTRATNGCICSWNVEIIESTCNQLAALSRSFSTFMTWALQDICPFWIRLGPRVTWMPNAWAGVA